MRVGRRLSAGTVVSVERDSRAAQGQRYGRHAGKCLHVLIAHSLAKGPGLNPFGDEALVLAAEPRTAATLVAGQWR